MDIVYNIQQEDDQAIPSDISVDWGFTSEEIRQAQLVDQFCTQMMKKVVQGKFMIDQVYHVKDGILRKYVTDNKQRFDTIVVPILYTLALLRLAHDELGHNGSARTYILLRRLYYWKGMKPYTINMLSNVGHVNKETGRLLNMYRDNLKFQPLLWNLFPWI